MILACSDSLFLTLLVVTQIFGLASVICARLCEGSRFQSLFYSMFFIAYILVGAGAMSSVSRGENGWLCCVVTLTIMSVGAVLDSTRAPLEKSFRHF
ncbi:hypothetical protein [Lignipirellula cremea]|uniref:Uncharacterized protein n=1 Tax=Lignipirellula cremea TaxID=2528010 RepID=A0A518DWX0_9BACT|nr:hypothetical protein [Lignipirellula cremea]QDU96331.1 hypothetical protein Pla8534_41510 [Lignipirellula cremea]